MACAHGRVSPMLDAVPDALPPIFTTAAALAAGFTPGQIRYRLRQGQWLSLHRDVLCAAETVERMNARPDRGHLLRLAAAQQALRHPSWASHESAARLHGLALPPEVTQDVVLTQRPGSVRPRAYEGVSIHVAGVPAKDATAVHRCPTLSVARTVVDLARAWPLGAALVVGDSALRTGEATLPAIHDVLRRCSGWPGAALARRSVEHMDGRRETPLESVSWAMFVLGGLELPEVQVWIEDVDGRLLVRVDFLWRRQRVIGEADGALKYLLGAGNADADPTVLLREKRRQEALERLGYGVVRWDWADAVYRQVETLDRIRWALWRGERSSGESRASA